MYFMQKKRVVTVLVMILFVVFPKSWISVYGQAQTTWEPSQWVPGLVDTSANQFPVFITDPMGNVHLFHSQWMGDTLSIFYSRWAVGLGWTQPVDIYMPTWGQARIIGGFLDNAGYINLVYWGGDEIMANMYYLKAPLVDVGKATAWSRPVMVGSQAISPTTAAVAGDGVGEIVIVYSGKNEGSGLYYIVSSDFGANWSEPELLFHTGSDSMWATEIKLYQSSNRRYHAVWALADLTGNSRAVYYSRYDSGQKTWTKAKILARAIEFEADTPSIIEHNGSLIVIYHNDLPTTRWMIRSFDGGDTWTEPERLFEQVGSNGPAALVIDSSNTLHMFFGNRVGNPAVHGLWHSKWDGSDWSVPEAVVSGAKAFVGPNGEEGFDPHGAQAVISQGNLLLVAWRHDPGSGPTHIWYTYRYLDTPRLPTQTIPAPLPTFTPEVRKLFPSPTPRLPEMTFASDIPEDAGSENINSTLLISIVPALILTLAVVVIKRRNR